MERYYDVIRRIRELLETIESAFKYLEEQTNTKNYSEAVITLEDIIEGIFSIKNAVEVFIDKLEINDIEIKSNKLNVELSKTIDTFESRETFFGEDIYVSDLTNTYMDWKNEILRATEEYTIS